MVITASSECCKHAVMHINNTQKIGMACTGPAPVSTVPQCRGMSPPAALGNRKGFQGGGSDGTVWRERVAGPAPLSCSSLQPVAPWPGSASSLPPPSFPLCPKKLLLYNCQQRSIPLAVPTALLSTASLAVAIMALYYWHFYNTQVYAIVSVLPALVYIGLGPNSSFPIKFHTSPQSPVSAVQSRFFSVGWHISSDKMSSFLRVWITL